MTDILPDDGNTTKELHDWLKNQIALISKSVELRLEEATSILTAFTSGQIDREAAYNRMMKYDDRWGETPIPGVMGIEERTNAEIRAQMDAAIEPEAKKAPWWRDGPRSSEWTERVAGKPTRPTRNGNRDSRSS